jgi:ribosomal protein S18 acetylase RimI-like enzyme
MYPDIVFRSIRHDECRQAVDLHRAVFPLEQCMRTIYACPNVDRYLANLLTFPSLQKEHVLWGSWAGESLVGYAHFRTQPECWHLNYIGVLPEYQGHGIGRQLFTRWLEMGRRLGYRRLSLYVEHDNQQALDWYQRKGLVAVGRIWKYEKETELIPTAVAKSAVVRLLDWEVAEACQLAYGFSQFRLVCQERIWTVGRLGEEYFRLSDGLSQSLEVALAEVDPARRLLIWSSAYLDGELLESVGISIRMQGNL